MEKAAVIVAGGIGTRMGTELPKQFLEVNGKPIFVHTLDAFFSAFPEIQTTLVLPAEYLEMGVDMVQRFFPGKPVNITEGGPTRFDSVKNGLARIHSPSVIFVHDAVRCLVSSSLIHLCNDSAIKFGSAIPVIHVKDSIRRIIDGRSEVVERESLRAVQTPQTFRSDILLPAFDREYQVSFTDEATVVERSGLPIFLVQGEEMNIKVTYPEDIEFAQQVLSRKMHND